MKHSSSTLVVGAFPNRNWILGNLMKEIRRENPEAFKICWTPSAFSSNSWIDNRLGGLYSRATQSKSFLFTFPSLFSAFSRNWDIDKDDKISLVLYTHNIPELGEISRQVSILRTASLVYFMSNRDRNSFVSSGLSVDKTDVLHFGFRPNFSQVSTETKLSNLVVMASNYSSRKQIEKFWPIVRERHDLQFVALGRNWEQSKVFRSLVKLDNFSYYKFSLQSRDYWFPRALIFMSLSSLEGGPVPLLEALSARAFPIVTDTGFCRDFIKSDKQGLILPTTATTAEIIAGIEKAETLIKNKSTEDVDVSCAYWPRVAQKITGDLQNLLLNR